MCATQGCFVFLFFEAARRVGLEAWMGMLSRHFESLIWIGKVSLFLCSDAKGMGIILQQASLGWLLQVTRARAPAGCGLDALGWFCIRYQTHIMYVFGQLYKCGCSWLLIRELPTQKEMHLLWR